MIVASFLVAMIPPPLPPSGPVRGELDCLFEDSDGLYAAKAWFREDAPATEVVPRSGEREAFQATFHQFPINTDTVRTVEFGTRGTITILGSNSAVVGRFSPALRSMGEGRWMTFHSPNSDGEFVDRGTCFGYLRGRSERPVVLTRISNFRVE